MKRTKLFTTLLITLVMMAMSPTRMWAGACGYTPNCAAIEAMTIHKNGSNNNYNGSTDNEVQASLKFNYSLNIFNYDGDNGWWKDDLTMKIDGETLTFYSDYACTTKVSTTVNNGIDYSTVFQGFWGVFYNSNEGGTIGKNKSGSGNKAYFKTASGLKGYVNIYNYYAASDKWTTMKVEVFIYDLYGHKVSVCGTYQRAGKSDIAYNYVFHLGGCPRPKNITTTRNTSTKQVTVSWEKETYTPATTAEQEKAKGETRVQAYDAIDNGSWGVHRNTVSTFTGGDLQWIKTVGNTTYSVVDDGTNSAKAACASGSEPTFTYFVTYEPNATYNSDGSSLTASETHLRGVSRSTSITLTHVYDSDGLCHQNTSQTHYQPCSGSGTSADPYVISNKGNLCWFSDVTNGYNGLTRNLAAQGKLTTDLDMKGLTFTSIGLYSDTKSSKTWFTGVFDGQGHVISNLSVTAPETYEAGFVSRLRGTVKNLILYKETVKAKPYVSARIGGIAGLTFTSAVISCCGVIDATLTNESDNTVQLGGIVGGYADGSIAYTFTDHNKFFGVGDLSIHTNCFENVSSDWKTSGELCFRLNGGAVSGQTWHQNLSGTSTDVYPIPTATNHSTVYITLNNNCEFAYTNTAYTSQTLSVSVGTAAKLNNVARLYGNGFTGGKVNVTLTSNIEYKSYTTAADMIGNADHPYSGTFNANGYTVNVAFNTSEQYAALFRFLDGATIKGRLHVTGSVTTSAKFAAGVAARLNNNASTFDEVWSQVTINSSLGSSSSVADGTHGGFVGVADANASFTACFFNGKFNGAYTSCWGGLVGWTGDKKTLTINNCYLNLDTSSSYSATGSATWARGNSGVLEGSNNCHTFTMGATWSDARTLTTGAVTSGELCWYLNGGTINGTQKWNQKIGTDNIPVWASYRANVADTSKNPNASTTSNTVYQGYYHGQSTLVYSNHVVHTSAAPHHTASDYVNGIFDCSTCYATVHEQPSGSGTSASPYLITNAGNLIWFRDVTNSGSDACYGKMTDDVDMNKINWNNGIGESGAKIYFNGNSCTIKNLNTGTSNSGGKARALFCHNYGSITNLTLESPDIYHNDAYQGCLVRRNWATIENCLVLNGNIQAGKFSYLAGFCGVNEAGGTINNCGIVNTNVQRTGVTGWHADAFVDVNCPADATNNRPAAIIKNCYAKDCKFTNTSNSWFVAFNYSDATLENCYFSWGSSVSGTKHAGCLPHTGSGAAEYAPAGLHLIETSQFTDGYATFKLNNNAVSNQAWYQNLSGTKDAYPVLNNTHSTVYITLNNNCEFAYTNTAYANQTLSVSPGTAAKLNNVARLYANGFTGGTVNVTLTNDIDYTAYKTIYDMIGCFDARPYKGVFNGQGHSLKVDITHGEHYVAPFRSIDGATIKNLYLYGSVTNTGTSGNYGKCTAGVASHAINNASTLENIICDVQINSSYSGGSANGGLIAHAYTADVTINNCAYRGKFNGANASDWGGFIGWIENGKTGTITNSYVALADSSSYSSTGCATFARTGGTLAGSNNYYIMAIGDTAQCADASGFKAGELCYKLNGSRSVGTEENPLAWYQTLTGTGADAYPILTKKTGNTVYFINNYYCDAITVKSTCYSNDANASKTDKHEYEAENNTVNGFCHGTPNQEHLQPASLVSDYYQIGNAGQLYWFTDKVNNENATYKSAKAKLTDNIVVNNGTFAADGTFTPLGETEGVTPRTWTPIGKGYIDKVWHEYCGTFDGDNHTISGLYFNNSSRRRVGLIGYLHNNAYIKNVGVINSYFSAAEYVGCICGVNDYGTITNCYATGIVINLGVSVGGVCGRNNLGTITNCYAAGTVTGSSNIGGLCGENSSGTITNCYAAGAVTGSSNIGGLCGNNSSSGTITNCYTSQETAIGENFGNTTNVEGGVTPERFNSGEITWKLNSGNTGGDQAWYQTLPSTGAEQTASVDAYPVLLNSHSTVYQNNRYYCDGVTVVNTIYSNVNGHVIDKHEYEAENNTVNGFCHGTPNQEHLQPAQLVSDYYQIGNAGQLYWFADKVNNENATYQYASAKLTADIVVNKGTFAADGTWSETGTPRTWTPIGKGKVDNTWYNYMGIFNGDGHTVSGLYFNNTDAKYIGLIGSNGGTITNVGVVDSYFKADMAGLVCGSNSVFIYDCYATGTVTGTGTIGGICGMNTYIIGNCYATGTVTGTNEIGGICGYSTKIISGCYTSNDVAIGNNRGTSTNVEGGVTPERFNSGEITWKLNGSIDESGNWAIGPTDGTQAWYQVAGTGYPSLVKAADGSNTIYSMNRNYNNTGRLSLPMTNVDGTYYTSLSCDFPFTVEDADVYVATAAQEGVLTMTKTTDNMAAGEGVVLKGDTAIATLVYQASATAHANNLLHGTTEVITETAGKLVFAKAAGIIGFYKWTIAGKSIPAFKAYLNASELGSASESNGYRLAWNEEATAVNQVVSSISPLGEQEEAIYNLQGIKLNAPQRGMNIINGQKVMVK